MDGDKELEITVSPGSGTGFVAGQPLTGYLTVNLRKPLDMKSIHVELVGKAYCYWTEGESDNYIGKETIIKKMVRLCGASTEVSHSFSFPTGEQVYPFTFDLPDRLPSTFEGDYGYVRYTLKGVISRHWKADQKTKLNVTINDRIDSNLDAYKEGPGGERHKKVGLLCYKPAPLDMSANIDRCCYCPGESILVTSSVTNNTSRDMPLMHAKLVQTVTYSASGKTKKSSKVVARMRGPCIPKNKCESWENKPFDVPAHLTPTITNCHVLSVHYTVVVKVRIRCASDPTIKMDIVVGTVPFQYTPHINAGDRRGVGDEPPNYNELVGNDNEESSYLLPPPTTVVSSVVTEDAPPRYSAMFGESPPDTDDTALVED